MPTGFEHSFGPEWGPVLDERVSEEEARILLQRLAVQEISGAPTLSAVCEASGATPEVAGRILADIRGTTWQELFGRRVSAIERRLQDHDERFAQLGATLGAEPKSQRDRDADAMLDALSAQYNQERESKRKIAWVATVGLMLALVTVSFCIRYFAVGTPPQTPVVAAAPVAEPDLARMPAEDAAAPQPTEK
ncbi:MAG: hypothetical protein JSS71_07300 [Armatimonadetes bacterium]|nr:hypothetical protein [Armatimonadota bacterium]MBX3107564.1 hypothetical protein [Fimbriimonadaceae bacterium]